MKQLKDFVSSINKKTAMSVAIGMILGAALFLSIRFIFNNPEPVHYHANFAVFIDGKREEFSGPGYYEDVQACSATESPRGRTHMHQPDNNIAHVHDKNVTWGHFFESIGWTLGPDALVTTDHVYRTSEQKALTFYLNNKEVASPFDQVIGNEDVLVVSYGDGTADLKKQAEEAKKPTPAHTANVQNDPAACRGSEELSLGARLKKALW